ncbi:serine/threonine-protein phosphatase 7 long form homolog [Lycium ferocissimum]|uniref:serine/threonine-protein phosphatase 7 long form homolog n=1 Tax=Lycium ferocissimum TaxID=112874 RepID=UPI002815269E|nr:serine/threonine-protein phosphatase 7 long form homolog [Lycium ferocissimum]
MGTRVEVPAFCSLLQIWVWTRLRPFQPIPAHPPADYLTVPMPYMRRWSRGVRRHTETHHSLLPFRDHLNRMMAQTAFIWTSYDHILDELPAFCRAGQHIWMSRCPLIHMDIVEYHTPDRMLRQFGYVQNIAAATDWEHGHYVRDERADVDDTWRLHMQQQVQSWDVRMTSLAVVGHDTLIHVYMEWYMRITHIIIGNPSRRRPDGLGYVALAGAYEALVRTVQTMRYESTTRTEAPETAEYVRRMIELAPGRRYGTDYVPWPSFPHPPVRDPQGERPVRDLQGGLHLDFDDSMFEDFVFDTAPSASPALGAAQEPSYQASQEVHSSTPVDPSPGPTQETVEEPAQEPSCHDPTPHD